MVITWIIILITTVFGVLPIDELCQTLYESVNIKNSNVGNNSDRKINTDSSNIFVNPNGPLNLLHGYFCREKKQLYTKRLFSPGFNINYSLTRNGENSTFFRDNTGDTVNELEMDNKDASQYLTKYYEAVKMMYNVVNNEANIYTNGDTSLHRFLTQKLSKEDSFKLLAIMLLLAEGIELPLMFKNVKIKYKRQKNSQKTVQALLFKNDGNSIRQLE
ncbi:hypothetical protein PAEPH01_0612 [Pancytospora epiphaga]|nr:hypothetical protein PAEPH01_0612 [Pancytospora epiphaga]